uniref:Uncharacterized protein n=1 Tax=Fagus sylvatica TaxID=28930 RepID=A0A2N9FN35_FAGSY
MFPNPMDTLGAAYISHPFIEVRLNSAFNFIMGVLNNIGAGSMVVVRVCLGIGTYVGAVRVMSGTVPTTDRNPSIVAATNNRNGWLNGSSLPTPTKVILDFKTQLPL